jgi:hypothetical protein
LAGIERLLPACTSDKPVRCVYAGVFPGDFRILDEGTVDDRAAPVPAARVAAVLPIPNLLSNSDGPSSFISRSNS